MSNCAFLISLQVMLSVMIQSTQRIQLFETKRRRHVTDEETVNFNQCNGSNRSILLFRRLETNLLGLSQVSERKHWIYQTFALL